MHSVKFIKFSLQCTQWFKSHCLAISLCYKICQGSTLLMKKHIYLKWRRGGDNFFANVWTQTYEHFRIFKNNCNVYKICKWLGWRYTILLDMLRLISNHNNVVTHIHECQELFPWDDVNLLLSLETEPGENTSFMRAHIARYTAGSTWQGIHIRTFYCWFLIKS